MIENYVDAMESYFDARLSEVHSCIPGRITSYDSSTRIATVKALVKVPLPNGDFVEIPPIQNVPVIFQSSSDFSMTFPIDLNDGCLLLFSETSIGNFLQGNNVDVEPEDKSRFSLTDAICIPGLWSSRNVPYTPPNDSDAFIKFKDSTIQMTSDMITINGNLEVDV